MMFCVRENNAPTSRLPALRCRGEWSQSGIARFFPWTSALHGSWGLYMKVAVSEAKSSRRTCACPLLQNLKKLNYSGSA